VKVVFLADAPYIHTRRWIDHFVAEGVDCDVISFRPAEIEGARVHHINGGEPFGKARYLIHARRVRQLVHDLKPDLVHALHLTSYGFLGALSGAHPLVISVWGTDVLEAPHLTPFHGWLTRYALSHADAITATGLHLATETTRFTPRGKPVTVVPYGVDLDLFAPNANAVRPGRVIKNAHPEALEGRDSDDAPFVIGAASRFSPEKAVRYLIEAFALLRRRLGERVLLRLAGEGPESAKLEGLARELGIADAVEFAGWLEHDALPAFLNSLDVFVLPSTYEGFGVSAVEASAAGLPVVASDVHGIPDVVRHGVTGLLVAPKDPQALADAIASLADDAPLRRRLGDAGRTYVSTHYDWRANAAQMDRLYETVLAQHKVAAGA
jgi:glycosyltransferase involved in cell wall biosynthesis